MSENDGKIHIKLERHKWPDEVAEIERQKKEKRSKLVTVILIVIAFMLGWLGNNVLYFMNSKDEYNPTEVKIEAIWSILNNNWYFGVVDEDREENIINRMLYGMTTSEEDPHTTYMSSEEIEAFTQSINMNYSGIGVQFFQSEGISMVEKVFANSPADQAGVLPGDVFYEVDGVLVEDKTSTELSDMVKGVEGTPVTIVFDRQGELVEVTIVRADLNATCYGEMLTDTIGYLELYQFGEDTAYEVETYVGLMKNQGMKDLIINLRDNGGGYLGTVVDIASKFLPKNSVVLKQEYPNGTVQENLTKEGYIEGIGKIVVLINENTASASEVLTLALSEQRDNVTIVGTTSYGKGTVQTTTVFKDNSALKYTTSKWLSSKDAWVNGVGITPDIVVEVPDVMKTVYLDFGEEEVYSLDSVSEANKQIQLALQFLGYEVARTDGYFDESFKVALEKFEKEKEFDITGTLNQKNYTSILSQVQRAWNLDKKYDNQLQKAIEVINNG
ncbi:MAG: PDZ domain-containing protein [Erysipelotrichaceae bacterium]|nr:PDZ domain-containing protein [Erysipelotrichaceae bacterium]